MCGSLNAIGTDRLIRSSTIRRCDLCGRNGLFGGCVSLWKWVLRSHICSSYAQHLRALLIACQDVGLPATYSAPCLPVCCHVLL